VYEKRGQSVNFVKDKAVSKYFDRNGDRTFSEQEAHLDHNVVLGTKCKQYNDEHVGVVAEV